MFLIIAFFCFYLAGSPLFPSSILEEGLTPCSREKGCFQFDQEEDPTFFAFVSFSMPESLWLEMSHGLERSGGTFVLKGFPENSFQKFLEKTMDLRNKGTNTPITVDPDAFERYQVTAVPTFVLEKEEGFRKVVGNVTPLYALEKLQEGF